MIHQGRVSVNDYTLVKGVTLHQWQVLIGEETLSDHRYIVFKNDELPVTTPTRTTKTIDMDRVEAKLTDSTDILPNLPAIKDRLTCNEAADTYPNPYRHHTRLHCRATLQTPQRMVKR